MKVLQVQQTTNLPRIKLPNEKIPIIKHILKDEETGSIVEGEKLISFDLERVIKLFVDPHSVNLTERHLFAIKKICKTYKYGFIVRDVVKIVKIINILADKVETDMTYIPCICSLLKIFQFPFVKEKSSDELVYEAVLAECIANIGYLFRTPNREVRAEICNCVYNLITFENVPPVYAELQRLSKNFVLKIIQKSDLAETLVKSLALMEEDAELRLKMIKILQKMSKDTDNCMRMLNADCANRLVLKMNQSSDEILFRSVDILWNLIENGDKVLVAEQLNSLVAVNQLRDAFLRQLLQGYSNYDRQLRNDILIISIQLCQIMPQLPFIESGFAKELLLFATYPEIKSHNPLTKNLKLSTCYEDFELKKLFFNFALTISRNPMSYQLLSESGILLALLSFIKSIEKNRDIRDWTISQFEELQLHAMSGLCIIIPILIRDYFSCHGSNRLLTFLEWCGKNLEDYAGYGNSFHAKGGRGTKKAQLKYCLRVIRSIVTTSNEQAIQDLADQDALSILSNCLKQYSSNDTSNDQIDVEIQADILFILTCICENDIHRKELFGNFGVDILIELLKKKPQTIWNGLGYQRLIIGAVDCIWETVVGCIINEDYFIQKEGVFYLLDILEISPKSMQNLILGCILDLSDNPKTLNHLLQWEGKDSVKIAHFLCELWRDEERDNGVERDENGIILNTLRPLAPADNEDTQLSLPSYLPSKSIVEVSENMRAKIYGLFSKLGFNDLSGTNNQDQLTLCIIENYLDFKLSEVFKEINIELQIDGIQPIPPDQEALDTILRAADDRVLNVNMNQKLLANTFKQQEFMQEKEFYYEIKNNFSFKEKKIQEWKDYVSRVSKYQILMSSKEKQITAIDDSRPPEREPQLYETLHNLEIPNLAVTAFAGPYIAIDSTPAAITGGRLKKIIYN